MRLCDLDEIKICVDRQYENCHGYSGSKKAIYREAILAVKSMLHSAKSIDGVTVQEWVSVDDRLPEESGFYLVFADLERSEVLPYSKKYQAFNAFDDNYSEENVIPVTHWMPMPEPPEREKTEE